MDDVGERYVYYTCVDVLSALDQLREYCVPFRTVELRVSKASAELLYSAQLVLRGDNPRVYDAVVHVYPSYATLMVEKPSTLCRRPEDWTIWGRVVACMRSLIRGADDLLRRASIYYSRVERILPSNLRGIGIYMGGYTVGYLKDILIYIKSKNESIAVTYNAWRGSGGEITVETGNVTMLDPGSVTELILGKLEEAAGTITRIYMLAELCRQSGVCKGVSIEGGQGTLVIEIDDRTCEGDIIDCLAMQVGGRLPRLAENLL